VRFDEFDLFLRHPAGERRGIWITLGRGHGASRAERIAALVLMNSPGSAAPHPQNQLGSVDSRLTRETEADRSPPSDRLEGVIVKAASAFRP
jgi:hypothetical protein